jgi:hypothetical protein
VVKFTINKIKHHLIFLIIESLFFDSGFDPGVDIGTGTDTGAGIGIVIGIAIGIGVYVALKSIMIFNKKREPEPERRISSTDFQLVYVKCFDGMYERVMTDYRDPSGNTLIKLYKNNPKVQFSSFALDTDHGKPRYVCVRERDAICFEPDLFPDLVEDIYSNYKANPHIPIRESFPAYSLDSLNNISDNIRIRSGSRRVIPIEGKIFVSVTGMLPHVGDEIRMPIIEDIYIVRRRRIRRRVQ